MDAIYIQPDYDFFGFFQGDYFAEPPYSSGVNYLPTNTSTSISLLIPNTILNPRHSVIIKGQVVKIIVYY